MTEERILVIEDSLEMQQALAELVLEPNQFRYLKALDGEQGLKMILDERPDVVILDMGLPRMNGLEVLENLRQREVSVPIIFTTIPESPELVVQAFRLGARDYVMKPFEAEEMLEAIQRALSSTRLLAERDQLTQQLLKANQQLERQLQELNAVYSIGRSVTSVLDLNRVLNRVVEAAVYVAGAEEGLLLLLDEEGKELYLRASKHIDEELAQNMRVQVDDSIAGQVLRSGRPVLISGRQTKVTTGYLARTVFYLPLRAPERGVIGILGVVNHQSDYTFSQRDVFLLSALADYAAIAIENARLFETIAVEEAKLEAVLRQAQEPIIVVNQDNQILLCNAAACTILDLEADAAQKKPVTEVLANKNLCEAFRQASETGTAVHTEVPLDDGRTFNAQITPIEGVGRALVMQDITHLKELDRIKSELVTNVSHDLRTPLTSIQGYVELLPRVGPMNEQQEEFIQRVHESMDTISELISALLDIDRIEAGYDLKMVTLDLRQVIDASIRDIRPLAQEKQQDLRWKPPEKLPWVVCNQHRIRQVIDNLLSNAIKYTPEGGWIEVTVGEDDGHVVVHVADNGIGIPPAQQPYIFDKFFRVESEETVDIVGSGLGLSIVKTVVEKHNGRVWVQSKPGEGSVFSFLLPAVKSE